MSREWYNKAEMRKMGIRFQTDAEMNAFINIIEEEFTVRVGDAVSKYFSDSQIEEFERNYGWNEAQTIRMVREICPDHREICIQVKRDFDREIMLFKSQISGVIGEAES